MYNSEYIIRKEKLSILRKNKLDVYPNNFKKTHIVKDLLNKYNTFDIEYFKEYNNIDVKIAGRIILKRIMGKASFITLQDISGQLQIYISEKLISHDIYQEFKNWDIGDIIGIDGYLFKTKTDELTIKATFIILLTKSLRSLPDKFHGLKNTELKYRYRYLDLIMNENTKKKFIMRSQIIDFIRNYFNTKDFLEVETPMMHYCPGGAIAKPFKTYNNSLNTDMYLRIAPELFLKRLIVGGFEKIYELNRNFRNENLSRKHNPEFTMIEFYQAYSTYEDLILLTEDLLYNLVSFFFKNTTLPYQDMNINFSIPFKRMTMLDSIVFFNSEIKLSQLLNIKDLLQLINTFNIDISEIKQISIGAIQFKLFEKLVENKIIDPTFITEYPIDISPLSKRNINNENIADRFELFIGKQEIANGFSELNDPEDQSIRFKNQIKNNQDDNMDMHLYDNDYITAMEYGLPPTAGEGIGIDRLIMLLTNSASIRDVLLFPHLKPI
jgi:lysyl-tRNA synthetase class 2